jgi:hypothetical protein
MSSAARSRHARPLRPSQGQGVHRLSVPVLTAISAEPSVDGKPAALRKGHLVAPNAAQILLIFLRSKFSSKFSRCHSRGLGEQS